MALSRGIKLVIGIALLVIGLIAAGVLLVWWFGWLPSIFGTALKDTTETSGLKATLKAWGWYVLIGVAGVLALGGLIVLLLPSKKAKT